MKPSKSDEDEPSNVIGIPISGKSVENSNFAMGEESILSGFCSVLHPPKNNKQRIIKLII